MNRKTLYLILLMVAQTLIEAQAVTYRALIFGLGKQEDTRWSRIHGDNDIYYVRQLLLRMGYTDIRTLRNEEATKNAMCQAFVQLAMDCERGDIVYVHYSGHGQLMTDIDGDEALKWNSSHADWDEAWIPYDAYMTYCPEDRGEKHLCDDEIAHYLQAIREKIGRRGELRVIVDACHSGDATSGYEDECIRGVDTKFCIPKKINAPQPELVAEEWQTVSACKPYQLCTEMRDLQVGKLTYALYRLGATIFKTDNEQMEEVLHQFIQQHKGRLPQDPMVSGKK